MIAFIQADIYNYVQIAALLSSEARQAAVDE
jgi:hypothetical protein